ncbi:hypothetical protein GCM10023144_41020 [Pigmentiphaga soli]|uniref:Uncharacterized protein n=1 Tax=Pigmentiphaga soli TaxID=1007095 RepID=A0ABP8HLC0_9BURK
MFKWIANIVLDHQPTPERLAERALREARLELFRAEQRVHDALLYANYHRDRVRFLERVKDEGIERVADQGPARQSMLAELKPHPKLASGQ